MPGVNLLKAETAEQADAGGVVGENLHLDDAEELILQVTQQLSHQELGQALSPHFGRHYEIGNIDGMFVPALRVRLHLPEQSASRGSAGQLVLQAILMQLHRSQDALLPPRCPLEGTGANFVAQAMGGEAAITDVERAFEGTLKDQATAFDGVAVVLEERPSQWIAIEKTGRIAAAVDAERVGIERIHGAGEQLLAPARLEVCFGAAEKFGANALAPKGRRDAEQTNDAVACIQTVFDIVRTEARPGEAGYLLIGLGDNQTLRIKVDFGEQKVFHPQIAVHAHGAAAGEGFVPNFDQPRRISVAECSVQDHAATLSSEFCVLSEVILRTENSELGTLYGLAPSASTWRRSRTLSTPAVVCANSTARRRCVRSATMPVNSIAPGPARCTCTSAPAMSLSQRSRKKTRLSRLVSLTDPRTAPHPLCSLSRRPSVRPSNFANVFWKTPARRSASSLQPQLVNAKLRISPCRI